jgi:hypothetical protein
MATRIGRLAPPWLHRISPSGGTLLQTSVAGGVPHRPPNRYLVWLVFVMLLPDVAQSQQPSGGKYLAIGPPSAGTPGLYAGGKRFEPGAFEFVKREMSGLMIPAYYDGTYKVRNPAQVISAADARHMYWVPKNPVTLGANPLASNGGLLCFRVGGNGIFARYNMGRAAGDRVELKISPLVDEVRAAHGGLVQQKAQVFRLETPLPPGEYVVFPGGGNALDNEPHPEAELGCWHLKVSE